MSGGRLHLEKEQAHEVTHTRLAKSFPQVFFLLEIQFWNVWEPQHSY